MQATVDRAQSIPNHSSSSALGRIANSRQVRPAAVESETEGPPQPGDAGPPASGSSVPAPPAPSKPQRGFVKGTGYGGDPKADARAAQNAARRQAALSAATHEDALRTVLALDALCKACAIKDTCLPVRCWQPTCFPPGRRLRASPRHTGQSLSPVHTAVALAAAWPCLSSNDKSPAVANSRLDEVR